MFSSWAPSSATGPDWPLSSILKDLYLLHLENFHQLSVIHSVVHEHFAEPDTRMTSAEHQMQAKYGKLHLRCAPSDFLSLCAEHLQLFMNWQTPGFWIYKGLEVPWYNTSSMSLQTVQPVVYLCTWLVVLKSLLCLHTVDEDLSGRADSCTFHFTFTTVYTLHHKVEFLIPQNPYFRFTIFVLQKYSIVEVIQIVSLHALQVFGFLGLILYERCGTQQRMQDHGTLWPRHLLSRPSLSPCTAFEWQNLLLLWTWATSSLFLSTCQGHLVRVLTKVSRSFPERWDILHNFQITTLDGLWRSSPPARVTEHHTYQLYRPWKEKKLS